MPPQRHVLDYTILELRADIEWAAFEHVSFGLQVPYRVNHTSVGYETLDGAPLTLDFEDIHHRDETIHGVGDLWVTANARGRFGAFAVSGLLGLTIPTGRTVEDPFALGEAGEAHQHQQLGSGTVNPLLGVNASWTSGPWSVLGRAFAHLVPYESERGFQAGHRFMGGLGGHVALGAGFGASLGVEVSHETAERWDGEEASEGNLGRTDLLAAAGVTYALRSFAASLDVRVPFYSHITQGQHDDGQLTLPVVIALSFSGVALP